MKLYTLAVLSEHKRPKVSVKLKHPSVYMELLILPQIMGFYYLFIFPFVTFSLSSLGSPIIYHIYQYGSKSAEGLLL